MSCIFCVKDIVSISVCGFQGTCADKIKLLAERSKTSFCRPAALRPYLHGDGGIRTLDPLLARQVLSQLSYTPIRESVFCFLHPLNGLFHYQISLAMGLSGLEPPTSRLSGVRSNRLSYKPIFYSGSHLLSHAVSNIVSSAA